MKKILFDASVYIEELRAGRDELLSARSQDSSLIYLSAVVGAELRRGVRERKATRLINRLWTDFAQINRLIVPSASDWYDSGRVLAQIAAKYGYEQIGQARLLHDTLIVLSARRFGVVVATYNQADFARIAEFRPIRLVTP